MVEVMNSRSCPLRGGKIIEGEKKPAYPQNDKQEKGGPSKAKRGSYADSFFRDLYGVDVPYELSSFITQTCIRA